MRLFLLIALVGTVSGGSIASAQSTPTSSPTTLLPSNANNCSLKYYPTEARRLNEEGSVVIVVHIDNTGIPTGVDISQSSGFKDLDQASVDCAMQGWRYAPALMNGNPISSTKQYRITWKLTNTNIGPRLLNRPADACATIYANANQKWTGYQSALLEFRIGQDGAVGMPFVAIPSGDVGFDEKAMQCVANLKYTAAVVNNTPTEVSWSAAIRWSPHTGFAYTDAAKLGPFCPDDFFPASLWKGDPANPTTVSFHATSGGVTQRAAVEQSSGNMELDEAALKCVNQWHLPASLMGLTTDAGEFVRFTWKDGHAFIVSDPPN